MAIYHDQSYVSTKNWQTAKLVQSRYRKVVWSPGDHDF